MAMDKNMKVIDLFDGLNDLKKGIIRTVYEPQRRFTEDALRMLRAAYFASKLGFEIGNTSTPIIPLYVRDMDKTFLITQELYNNGIFINPVIPPACSPEDTLIRFSLMATHTKEQVDEAIDKLYKTFCKYEIIK